MYRWRARFSNTLPPYRLRKASAKPQTSCGKTCISIRRTNMSSETPSPETPSPEIPSPEVTPATLPGSSATESAAQWVPNCVPYFWGSEEGYVSETIRAEWIGSGGPVYERFVAAFSRLHWRYVLPPRRDRECCHSSCSQDSRRHAGRLGLRADADNSPPAPPQPRTSVQDSSPST